jgi:hypothetical protein
MKIRILSPRVTYSVYVRYFGVEYKILGILKNIEFLLKIQRGLSSILPKTPVRDEN